MRFFVKFRSNRERKRRATDPAYAGTIFSPTMSNDTFLDYHKAVRNRLVCERCGWNIDFHDDGECPTAGQVRQMIESDGSRRTDRK